jgi:hypothetical protein
MHHDTPLHVEKPRTWRDRVSVLDHGSEVHHGLAAGRQENERSATGIVVRIGRRALQAAWQPVEQIVDKVK